MTDQEFYVCAGYLVNPIRKTNIEVEMIEKCRVGFENDYTNWTHGYPLPDNSSKKPYYVYPEGANKWGKEFRFYANFNDNIPQSLSNIIEPKQPQSRPGYEESNRGSRNEFVKKLFRNGFVLGNNQNYSRIKTFIPNQYLTDFNTGYNL